MQSKRRLIQKNETAISILQIVGFVLILMGVISLMTCSFLMENIISSIIAISFLVTMLGVSFAFPSLLEGNEGLSTMRIVVFMITNVICMLLLKVGWAAGITSLKQIGLDQYWMGVIAFVFGAKAIQSFFESKIAVAKENNANKPTQLPPPDRNDKSNPGFAELKDRPVIEHHDEQVNKQFPATPPPNIK